LIRPLVALSLALALLASAGGCASYQEPPSEPDPPPFELRLGPGDRIRVSVWGEDRLAHDVEVGPDGSISFPLIGDVQVVGLTLDELRVEVAQRIKALVVDPVVSVSLLEIRSALVHVLGEVVRPGPVSYVRGATSLGAVQAAGGYLAPTADLAGVRVIRDRMGARVAFEVDLEDVLAGEANDMWLMPGDVVYVPPRLLTRWDRWWRQASPFAEPVDLLPRQQR
jgi:polysaccharide biosynthesis/export protein